MSYRLQCFWRSKLNTDATFINPTLTDFWNNALNTENRIIFPTLLHLNIYRIRTSVIQPVDLNYDFINPITAGKTLADISNLNILKLYRTSAKSAWKSNEHVTGSVTYVTLDYSFKSLRKLDMSGIILPVLRTKFSFQIIIVWQQMSGKMLKEETKRGKCFLHILKNSHTAIQIELFVYPLLWAAVGFIYSLRKDQFLDN